MVEIGVRNFKALNYLVSFITPPSTLEFLLNTNIGEVQEIRLQMLSKIRTGKD